MNTAFSRHGALALLGAGLFVAAPAAADDDEDLLGSKKSKTREVLEQAKEKTQQAVQEAAAPADGAVKSTLTVPPFASVYTATLKLGRQSITLEPGDAEVPVGDLTVVATLDTGGAPGPGEVRYTHAHGMNGSTLTLPWSAVVRLDGKPNQAAMVGPADPVPRTLDLSLASGLVVPASTAGLDGNGTANRIDLPHDLAVVTSWAALKEARAKARRPAVGAVASLTSGLAVAGVGGALMASAAQDKAAAETTNDSAEYDELSAAFPRKNAAGLAMLAAGSVGGIGGAVVITLGPGKKARAAVEKAESEHDAELDKGLKLSDYRVD
ncbi:MAG: hypothetical protein CL927_19225 [Deltaproteobacteria bacterium]|nr:hypothetical protein [Deltaproteobacteria bacterium]